MGKVDIWMPIFIGDYLRDTSELTGPEHGAYFLLLMHYWQKKGEIGDDVERLALVCRSEVKTCRFVLERFFTLIDGNYKNKRADEELLAAQNRSDTARTNVNKRWNKDSNTGVIPPYNEGNTGGDTESIPNGYSSSPPSPIPVPIQIPIHSEKEKEKSDFLPQLQSNPQKDGAARIEKARASWNSMAPGIGPTCRFMAITFKPEDASDCLRVMSVYSDEEILEAMVNYATLSKDPEADTPKYGSFVGFIRGGVEKFVASAEPEKAYKNHGKPPEESTADLLARIRREEGLEQ